MQQYFHLTGVLGRWLYAARRLALLERAIGSKPPRRWLYLAVFRIGKGMPQEERIAELNCLAIQQLTQLLENNVVNALKSLEAPKEKG